MLNTFLGPSTQKTVYGIGNKSCNSYARLINAYATLSAAADATLVGRNVYELITEPPVEEFEVMMEADLDVELLDWQCSPELGE